MREIKMSVIEETVYEMIRKALVHLNPKTTAALKEAFLNETCEISKYALSVILKNIEVAKEKNVALCQDTGMSVFFVEIGNEVFVDGLISEAIDNGVLRAYRDGSFRKSVLDPLTRINTKTNTPSVIHTEIVKGDKIKISFLAKGFGSENMSKVFMLTPAEGIDGIINSIVSTVKSAGSCPCPPIIVGVGIGGTMEQCAILSKKALLREIDEVTEDETLRMIEDVAKLKINELNIGAQGLGGKNTALSVRALKYPTHIAGLPVAVNIQCHSVRHETRII